MIRPDPNAILGRAGDPRHDLLDLQLDGDRLLGAVELAHAEALAVWARREGLRDLSRPLPSDLATVTRQRRLRARPDAAAAAVTEVTVGEHVERFDRDGEWVRVRTLGDRYLGWARADGIVAGSYPADHRVTALRAYAYAGPRVQSEVLERLAYGARLQVTDRRDGWFGVALPGGRHAFVADGLLAPADAPETRAPLESWQAFLGTPYLWGGGSAWGIDCSGFVQLLFRMAGRALPRDADEQNRAGTPVTDPRPGDVATFEGHIGLHLGDGRIVHASGRAMSVRTDVIDEVPALKERFLRYVRFDG